MIKSRNKDDNKASQSYWQTQNGALWTEHTTSRKFARENSCQHLAPTLVHDLAIQKCRSYQSYLERDSKKKKKSIER